MVLRWFRDDTRVRMLAIDACLPISTAYRYLHEGITVLAAQAPDLYDVLTRTKAEGCSHLTLDGTLIETDRVAAKNPDTGHDLWYSGKHKKQGRNVQILCDPRGFPVWSSPVEPGSTHDITAARSHVLPALYPAAAGGLPTLTDKGYAGAGIGIHSPTKGRTSLPTTPLATHSSPQYEPSVNAGTRSSRKGEHSPEFDSTPNASATSPQPPSSYPLSNGDATEKTSIECEASARLALLTMPGGCVYNRRAPSVVLRDPSADLRVWLSGTGVRDRAHSLGQRGAPLSRHPAECGAPER
jgi:DDE superfamily endonuclease